MESTGPLPASGIFTAVPHLYLADQSLWLLASRLINSWVVHKGSAPVVGATATAYGPPITIPHDSSESVSMWLVMSSMRFGDGAFLASLRQARTEARPSRSHEVTT